MSKIFSLSRNKASEIIKNGGILVNKKCIKKPSFEVENEKIEMIKKLPFVSRAGEKLAGFLSEIEIEIENSTCLDIGCSTGGFIQVLLEKGAKKVVGVDVGSGQLHESLRVNEKVQLHEKTDIRNFESCEKFDIITCDVSFISFKDIAYCIDKFAKKYIIVLFKPQFEVGKEVKRSKKGVVKDENAICGAKERFEKMIKKFNWVKLMCINAKLAGKEGNLESFYAFIKR